LIFDVGFWCLRGKVSIFNIDYEGFAYFWGKISELKNVVSLFFFIYFLGFVDNDGPYYRVHFNFFVCTFYFFFLHVGLLGFLFW
jgi:hypothetical protein